MAKRAPKISFKQALRNALPLNRESLEQYRRFIYLLRRYSAPYWGSFLVVVVLNLLTAGLNMGITAMTAATLGILSGRTPQMLLERKLQNSHGGFGGVSLASIGSLVFEYTGLSHVDNTFHLLLVLAVLGTVLAMLREILSYGSKLAATWLRIQTARAMQVDLFKHMMSFSMAFYNRHRAGELMSRLTADTNGTVSHLQSIVSSSLLSPIMLVFYSVLTFKASPMLFVAVIVSGSLFFILGELINKPLQKANREGLNLAAEMKSFLTETFTSIRVVKSFAAEQFECERLIEHQDKEKYNTMRKDALNQFSPQAKNCVNQIMRLCIVAFAAHELLVSKKIDLDTAVLFIFICTQLINPIRTMAMSMVHVSSMLTCSEKVFDYFMQKPEVRDGGRPVTELRERIVYENVGFSYGQGDVLQDVNLVLSKGKTTALVGPSGAGKSTMADLLLRFYDPTQGRITIDGVDLKEYNQASYRKLFGIVSQESLLFHTTIWHNITYGRTELAEEDIRWALRVANLEKFIDELPDGLQTMVGDRGLRLSGGQRQRLAIARAVVGRPQILVLDEATSSLDSQSEKEVQQAIDQVTENTTALIIAHRLSTILHAHNIVVMEKGRVLDQGAHSQLLDRCELYRELCRLQFGEKTIGFNLGKFGVSLSSISV
jgi:subfamily B ATP-binding cassette protein MsbA